MTDVVTEGGCLCGAVRYQVYGQPLHSMICHCQTCRKAAGAPVVAWLTFPPERFSFVRGTPAEFRSSPPVVRTFCSSCGTPLTYVHADRPADIDVTTCTLDDPDAFPPSHHSWVSHNPGWLYFNDGLPAYGTISGASQRRYGYVYAGHTWAVDVFTGRHAGLMLAEVEGETEDTLEHIALPPFVGWEVTNDPCFTGGTLAAVPTLGTATYPRRTADFSS